MKKYIDKKKTKRPIDKEMNLLDYLHQNDSTWSSYLKGDVELNYEGDRVLEHDLENCVTDLLQPYKIELWWLSITLGYVVDEKDTSRMDINIRGRISNTGDRINTAINIHYEELNTTVIKDLYNKVLEPFEEPIRIFEQYKKDGTVVLHIKDNNSIMKSLCKNYIEGNIK